MYIHVTQTQHHVNCDRITSLQKAEGLGAPALALERIKPLDSLSFDSLQMCNILRVGYCHGSFYA